MESDRLKCLSFQTELDSITVFSATKVQVDNGSSVLKQTVLSTCNGNCKRYYLMVPTKHVVMLFNSEVKKIGRNRLNNNHKCKRIKKVMSDCVNNAL